MSSLAALKTPPTPTKTAPDTCRVRICEPDRTPVPLTLAKSTVPAARTIPPVPSSAVNFADTAISDALAGNDTATPWVDQSTLPPSDDVLFDDTSKSLTVKVSPVTPTIATVAACRCKPE